MTRFIVVTGTDTGVGKTYVTEALARELSRSQRVVAIKPFESGVTDGDGDAERLARATGQSAPLHALIRLKAPLTPAVAADREGVVIDWAKLVAEIRSLALGADVALVEGAGGLLSPLTWTEDAITLARDLGADVVLVSADRLGTLSVTHAAVHVLAAASLSLAGIVLSAPAEADLSTGSNADALRRRLAAPRIVELPRGGTDLAIAEWLDQPTR